jgi:hypothetical protein
MVAIGGAVATTSALAYEEGEAGKAVVRGVTKFSGTPPPPHLFEFKVHSQARYCSRFDNDGLGNRVHRDVTVNNGLLQDVVVYLRDITEGKPFIFNGTDVKISGCRYLVQGGPSTFVGVVVKKAELRVLNDDADPSDPKTAKGVLHHPHAYEVSGAGAKTIFSLPLVEKGQILTKPVILRRDDSVMLLESESPNITLVWFLPVANPYYAIVGPSGTYEIADVPPGKHTLIAWHPILGTQELEVQVGSSGTVSADFEFQAPAPEPLRPGFPRDLLSKLHEGISAAQIEKMLGKPDSIQYVPCGSFDVQRQCYRFVYITQDNDGSTPNDNRLYTYLYLDELCDEPPTLSSWTQNWVD